MAKLEEQSKGTKPIKKKSLDSTETKSEEVTQKKLDESKTQSTEKTAKAGKRSAKAIAEAEEKAEKEARKEAIAKGDSDVVSVPNKIIKPARSRLERRGKKFKEAAKLVDPTKMYSAKEAVEIALKTSTTKFDATVEVHARLNVDPKQADQNIRDSLTLPAGTGKKVRVAVFAEDDDVKAAKAAGADVAGSEEFLMQLDKGLIDFDILISTPGVMVKLSKYARVLGPKGLMPNPKSGTVTKDVAKAVKESKAGKVEYRVDSTGIVHLGVGKVSFGTEKINQNLEAVFASIKQNKPASIKGTYIKSLTITTSMGPGIKVLPSELN